MPMDESTIQTGIYRHYKKDDLYFVEKTFTFKQSDKDDLPSVYYHSLYDVSGGFGRSISEFTGTVHVSFSKTSQIEGSKFLGIEVFGKTVKRFELVKPLDVKYLRFLIPGSTFYHVDARDMYKVLKCIMKNNEIIVVVSNGTSNAELNIDTFPGNCLFLK